MLSKIFGLYRTITKSHWKDPVYAHVQESLNTTGRFEFVAGPLDAWATKFVVSQIPEQGDSLDISINVNQDLPPALRKHAESYVARFKIGFERLVI